MSSSTRIQHILRYILCVCTLAMYIPSIYADGIPSGEDTTFIVTAYYSPLPDQSYYFQGTYESEKTMNGEWLYGASGKAVFAGMLAAPKGYAFGTHIYLEWVGVGQVADRWWAIVHAGVRGQDYDRIDIWVGSGEEGLRRALLWGRRTVKWKILSEYNGPYIDLGALSSGKIDMSKLTKTKTYTDGTYPQSAISTLTNLGYIDGVRTTREAMVAFQIQYGIIPNVSSSDAGVYGPRTQAQMAIAKKWYETVRIAEEKRVDESRKTLLSAHDEYVVVAKKTIGTVESIWTPVKWEKGEHVRTLQVTLRKLGYMTAKDTGTMGDKTIAALRAYQRDKWIVQTGTMTDATRTYLAGDMMYV